MKSIRNRCSLLALVLLLLASLACGTGFRTTYTLTGNSGKIRVSMNDADGENRTQLEINEDYIRESVAVTASLSVAAGSCQATLTGEDGSRLTLTAAEGNPGQANGELVTDAFGEITLETVGQNAENMELILEFTRQ